MRFWFPSVVVLVAVAAVSCESNGNKPAQTGGLVVPDTMLPAPAAVAAATPATRPAGGAAAEPMMMNTAAPTTAPAAAAVVTVTTTQPLLNLATTGPTTGPTARKSDDLGDAFISPTDGFEFNPPKNGDLRRVLNSGEIVGFAYPDKGWDIRVKQVPLPYNLPLSDPVRSGLLELTAGQLVTRDDSTRILKQEVFPFGDTQAGLIESRFNQGIDKVFAQEVLLRQGLTSYLMIQMVAPGGTTDADLIRESEARRVFHEVLGTFKLLDRASIREDQDRRVLATEAWYDTLTEARVKAAVVPMQYMRVRRKERDPVTKQAVDKEIGFIQFVERPVTRDGIVGLQMVVRSYMENTSAPATASGTTEAAAGNDPADGGGEDRIVVDKPVVPPVATQAHPTTVRYETYSEYFMSYDRAHEAWTSAMQIKDGSQPLSEFGSSDLTVHIALDRQKLKELGPQHRGDQQPPVKEVRERTLSVTPARGKTMEQKVPPFFYLPQMMGQMLPRLLPTEPKGYAFCSYVTDTRAVMWRYVDVGKPEDVVLDGVLQRAIPISDRVGLEGIPTTHYMSPDGKWLGSMNAQTGLEVLPTTAADLKKIWNGFVEYPDPPLPRETPIGKPGTILPAKNPVLGDQ